MIYLDNHASTQCDPKVVDAMLPWWSEHYANPHSQSHPMGRLAGDMISQSIEKLGSLLGAPSESIVITSGATESNNLAIRGFCTHPRQSRRHIITAATEHPAVLDVCTGLEREGFRVTRLPVRPVGKEDAGLVDLNQLADCIDDDTALVSIMWANNEIGAIAPMADISEICHRHGAILHSDATQAVGRIPVDVIAADIDLLSATAHKLYGPKGTGLLVVGNSNRRVRLLPQIVGGGQQNNRRSGTLNPAGVAGITQALQIAVDEMETAQHKHRSLRDRLDEQLRREIGDLQINGPALDDSRRLPGNLNFVLPRIEGAAWIAATPDVAFSSGSACSSVESKPSHVLTAIGLDDSAARRSVRFGVGRFNSEQQIDDASKQLVASYWRVIEQLGK